MSTRHHRAEILISALLGALAGLFVGFVWGSGLLDMVPSRHELSQKPSELDRMSEDDYRARIIRFAIGGVLAGTAAGAATGFYTVRRKDSASPPKGGSST